MIFLFLNTFSNIHAFIKNSLFSSLYLACLLKLSLETVYQRPLLKAYLPLAFDDIASEVFLQTIVTHCDQSFFLLFLNLF